MVYVDNIKTPYGRMKMNHMIADTHEELILMANLIGVKLKWIQYEGTYREHFDISTQKRELAIKFGATPISTRKLCKMLTDRGFK